MQLREGLTDTDFRGVQINLAAEIAQILGGTVVVFGDDFVAGAVVAKRLTKRNMNIERQGHCHARTTRAPE